MNSLSDWYNIKAEYMARLGVSTTSNNDRPILSFYNFSLLKALRSVYPEHDWHPWMFHSVPHNYWQDDSGLQNQRDYVKWLGNEIGIRKHEEWYTVSI